MGEIHSDKKKKKHMYMQNRSKIDTEIHDIKIKNIKSLNSE